MVRVVKWHYIYDLAIVINSHFTYVGDFLSGEPLRTICLYEKKYVGQFNLSTLQEVERNPFERVEKSMKLVGTRKGPKTKKQNQSKLMPFEKDPFLSASPDSSMRDKIISH